MTAADEHRELLSAIADALTLPSPATRDTEYYEALCARVAYVCGAIDVVANGEADPGPSARVLRRLTAEPVTYPTREATP